MTDITQEIMLVDIPITGTGPNDLTVEDQKQIESELARVNAELKKYTGDVTKYEYVLAVACGIVAGVVDARYTQPILRDIPAPTTAPSGLGIGSAGALRTTGTNTAGQKTARQLVRTVVPEGIDADVPIEKLVELARPLLKERATHLGPDGLVANVVLLLMTPAGKGAKRRTPLIDATPDDLMQLIVPAAMAGLIIWVCQMPKTVDKQQDETMPGAIIALADLVRRYPVLKKVAREANKWFSDLAANPEQLTKSAMGALGLTSSLMHQVERIDEFKNSDIGKVLATMSDQKTPIPSSLMDVMTPLDRQSLPVMVNEALVRSSFFLSRLVHEIQAGTAPRNLDWERIVPYGNRSIDRMITVASMTLTVVDTGDAAVCAAVESAGNEIAYAQRFVAHYNFVAAGRCVIAVVREVNSEMIERQLLQERRVLTERHAEMMIARIERYRQELQTRLDAYLAEDLEAFLGGVQMMDEGFLSGDSNLVIAGNVRIQKALGRESQFTNQQEFDSLMGSDEDFIL